MSFQIRKMTPKSHAKVRKMLPQTPSKNMAKRPSNSQLSAPSTSDGSSSPQSVKMKQKPSLQTIMSSKSTFFDQLNLSSTSWCLYDSNKKKYIGFRQKHQRQIASLTKIMTTILAIQFFDCYEISQELYVKVTQNSSKMVGTTAQLKANTWVKAKDLLYGVMLPSGNDAAHLLSQIIGYLSRIDPYEIKNMKIIDLTKQNTSLYTSNFVRMMNKKAQELMLKDTTFSNPHGLQNAMNLSTPKDLILLSFYATKNQHFRKIMNTDTIRYYYLQEYKMKPQDVVVQQIISNYTKQCRNRWWNTNALLNRGWQGVKTGQTPSAGSCLSSLKKGIYIVVLNCKDNQARFTQTQKIYEWYMQKCQRKQTENSNEY